MENNSLSRADYIQALQTGICKIRFTKKDGTERVLFGTLIEEIIKRFLPENSSTSTRPIKEDRLIVLDYDKGEWRTVLIDNIISFEPAGQ